MAEIVVEKDEFENLLWEASMRANREWHNAIGTDRERVLWDVSRECCAAWAAYAEGLGSIKQRKEAES